MNAYYETSEFSLIDFATQTHRGTEKKRTHVRERFLWIFLTYPDEM
jgi:hypothetical protein